MGDLGSAFVKGWFQGAVLMALALVLCGVLGREWSRSRHADDLVEPAPRVEAPVRKPAPPVRKAPARVKGDPGVDQARGWAACSGPACYHDVRATAGGYVPSGRTPNVNEGLR